MHSCGLENIAEVLQYSLAVLQFRSLPNNDLFYLSCYDATWTLGLALNTTLEGKKCIEQQYYWTYFMYRD